MALQPEDDRPEEPKPPRLTDECDDPWEEELEPIDRLDREPLVQVPPLPPEW
jgi:hypothetical protein